MSLAGKEWCKFQMGKASEAGVEVEDRVVGDEVQGKEGKVS